MKEKVLNNFWLKVASIMIAIILWLIGYNINDPMATKRFNNLRVDLLNSELLTDSNQIYEIIEKSNIISNVTIRAKSSIINDLKEDDIVLEADFNKMTMDGTININAYSTRHNSNIDSINLSNQLVKLNVENKVEKYIPLNLAVTGMPAEGYIINKKKIEQNQIYISGPESIVSKIAKASAHVDISQTRGDVSTIAKISLYSKEDAIIPQDRINLSIKQVSVQIEILATKEVPVEYRHIGSVASEYMLTGKIQSNYPVISIAGREDMLATINKLVIAAEELNVEGAVENVEVNLDIDEFLPSGIIRNDKSDGRLEVLIEVEPIISKTLTAKTKNINFIDLQDLIRLEFVNPEQEFEVVVTGIENKIVGLEIEDLLMSISVEEFINSYEGEVEEGKIYELQPIAKEMEEIEIAIVDTVAIVYDIKE